MLTHLTLKDFVIVRELSLDLNTGLTVLTGETGAGKSILIDAIQLILGARGDAGVVREGAKQADLTAIFDISQPAFEKLCEAGLADEAEDLLEKTAIIRRVIDKTGRSRSWINGVAVTLAQVKEVASDLLGGIQVDGNSVEKASLEQGYMGDEGYVDKNGFHVTRTNDLLRSAQDLAITNALMWRSQLTNLTDRMGTLRTTPDAAGVWARYKGGEWDGDSINQQFNGVEVGVDKAINQNFVVGLAASYIEGNGDLDNGSADTDSYSGAAYLSYYNSGWFVDVMGKLGKIETDFDLNYNGLKDSGDYTMSGYLFGVETGYRFNFNNFYVEPQVQLTYSYLGSKEFTTDNRTIDFETLESLIGRVGFMSGYDFGDIGSAYLRASYYHDFDGDVDMRVGHNDLFVTESDELNSDWGDVGIGANVNFGEATLFFDVSRSFGGDIDLEWKANAGARYMF